MFNKQNFCHIASNNRNDVKAGVFVYKTTDDLQTVLASGYFNEKIVDINLHDLIIHEWHDPTDRTKVEYNLLCVTERTLDNVGTSVIKTNWENGIEALIEQVQTDLDGKVNINGTSIMTGPLKMAAGSMRGAISPYFNGISFFRMDAQGNLLGAIASLTNTDFKPFEDTTMDIGTTDRKFKTLYVTNINNGYDIAVPVTNSADTLALKSEVDLAANSGDQLTPKGVWYAKMYAATVPPAATDGTNYADFSQVDGNGDPIIVLYERQSGAWVQTETITPPADYNGYVTVTSKIWDIPEQAGQQGGKVLWSHNQKTFTPYPQIISFEDAALTGNSTVAMPLNPTNDNIANKGYVDSAVAASAGGVDLFDMKQKDCTMNRTGWALADGNWKTSATAYQHLADEYQPEATDIVVYDSINQVSATFTRDSTQDMTIGDHSFLAWENSGMTIYTRDANMTLVYVYTGGTMVQDASLSITDVVYNTQTETIGNTTITFFVAADGHRICLPDQETNIDTIFAATGVAWYYILDEENQRFKLPRTQHGFVAYRDTVGAYVAPALPNIKGLITSNNWAGNAAADSALYPTGNGTNSDEQGTGPNGIGFNAHRNNAIYKDGATVQPPATQIYLYFYIGQ